MRKWLILLLGCLAALPLAAAEKKSAPTVPTRELHVPFDDLHLLFQHPKQQRVLLSREAFQALIKKAKVEEAGKPPTGALFTSAVYEIDVKNERAEFRGKLGLQILEPGIHALPLTISGLGLQSVELDGKAAAVGKDDKGQLRLFGSGEGEHTLTLQAVAPIQTTAARQMLAFTLPQPGAGRLKLRIPGDVEVKSGAAVVSRSYDAEASETRFELLASRSQVNLVMSLNSRLKRQERAVVARTVLVDEVTAAYERLNATVSLDVLHRAVKDFRFELPDGFEITEVSSPNLSRWEMAGNTLTVLLRDEVSGRVLLNLSGLKTNPDLEGWTMPEITPLDVIGHVAVIGLLAEDRLEARGIEPQDLITIDNAILMQAIPPTFLTPDPGAAQVRSVKSFYAPQGSYKLAASFVRPEPRVYVTSSLSLTLSEQLVTAQGSFTLQPREDKIFQFDFDVPAGWEITTVHSAGGKLPFERFGDRVQVRLPTAIASGQSQTILFQAVHLPEGWLAAWETREFDLPIFAVRGAHRDIGAIMIDGLSPLVARALNTEGLTPLDENDKKRFGVVDTAVDLAYRYESQGYAAKVRMERVEPRMTAEVYSFYRVQREVLAVRYELIYSVEQASVQEVAFSLPLDSPEQLFIRGLNGVSVKSYASEVEGSNRVWRAQLTEAEADGVHLAVDLQWPYSSKTLELPVPIAGKVAYQSGLVAIEGSQELDVKISQHPRKVDVGELVEADYLPGRRLLGSYGYVGEQAPLAIEIAEHPGYALPPAIIERSAIVSAVSASGVSQSSARFLLRSSALYVEVQLPEGSELWSAVLDGESVKPQRDQERILLELGGEDRSGLRDLQVVYETPVRALGYKQRVQLDAPRIFLHQQAGAAPREVPVTDLEWQLYLPGGFEVVDAGGNVTTDYIEPPATAVTRVGEVLWKASGGIDTKRGVVAYLVAPMIGAGVQSEMAASRQYSYDDNADLDFATVTKAEVAQEEAAPEFARETIAADATVRPAPGKPAGVSGERVDALAELGNTLSRSTRTVQAAPPQVALPPAPSAVTAQPLPSAAPMDPTSGLIAGKEVEAKAKNNTRTWAMQGLGSLKIDLHAVGDAVVFQSLGSQPQLDVEVTDEKRRGALIWALALAVFVLGLARTTATAGAKARYVSAVLILASLIPAIPGFIGTADLMNGAFYAGCALVPYYLLAIPFVAIWRRYRKMPRGLSAATAVLLVSLFSVALPESSEAAEQSAVPFIPVPQPIAVPDDAVVVPYLPGSTNAGERLLIPYARYEALLALANPAERAKPPTSYALAGCNYEATLSGDDELLVRGTIELDVFVDEYVEVPFVVDGGVFASALLDGKPARINIVRLAEPAQQKAKQQQRESAAPLSLLYVQGKGRHQLEVALRLKLERQGGWRVVSSQLPVAPATALKLNIPEVGTEINLRDVQDRLSYKSEQVNEVLNTTLGANGELHLQWRPRISEGEVDRTLTVISHGLFDVQEDHERLTWALEMNFRRGEREFFDVQVPKGYLVERVEGLNVRGWELEERDDGQQVKVRLLKRIKLQEKFTLHLRKSGAGDKQRTLNVPQVTVADAIRHTGRILLRRSPYLQLRTLSARGATRANLGEQRDASLIKQVTSESPLGIRNFEAYEFVAVPFEIAMETSVIDSRVSIETQAILRMGRRERNVEAKLNLNIQQRPIYDLHVLVPKEYHIEQVLASVGIEWELEPMGDAQQQLSIHFVSGITDNQSVVLIGPLGEEEQVASVDIPKIEVVGVERQTGMWAIQTDPGYDVSTENLTGLESILLSRANSWLKPAQRTLTRTVLAFKQAGYQGQVALQARKPIVSAYTVTNARITDRAIEETIMLEFNIKKAGIREVQFRVPAYLADARYEVPLLREKRVEQIPGSEQVLVSLVLQDEVIQQLRVLVEHDRLLDGETFQVAIPEILTGRTDRRFVARESAGRDEVVTGKVVGLDTLTAQMKEWSTVAPFLKGGTSEAWMVSPGAENPVLELSTRQRAAVQTAGATIGLAQTLMLVDAAGTYRAEQTYQVDNRTEQFLAVDLPEGAELWTAEVADEFVKPILPDVKQPQRIHIPLVKTAEGDLDFAVVLKYGGKMGRVPRFGKVSFPFVRTQNINVELSQVELRLPTTHRWLAFDGSMRREEAAGQLEAGKMGYLNKQAKRLVQTLQYGDEFSKARAYNSWGKLNNDLSKLSGKNVALYSDNAKVNSEAQTTESLLKQAEAQLRANDAQEKDILDVKDNRGNINDAFFEQVFLCPANMVNTQEGNFTVAAQKDHDGLANAIEFNEKWFVGNGLLNTAVDQKAGQIGGRFANPNQVDQISQLAVQTVVPAQFQQTGGLNDQIYYSGLNQVDPGQQAGGEVAQFKGKKVITRRGQEQLAFKYQQRLEQGQTENQNFEVPDYTVSSFEISGELNQRPAINTPASIGAGLASLEVNLPGNNESRWVSYQFTTPRGEVDVQARAMGFGLLNALKRFGVLLGLIVVVLLLRAIFAGRDFSSEGRGVLATAMILVGVAGLLIGILPMAGFILLVAGIWMKIRAKIQRRKLALAS